jgi:hypothetical protein
VGLTVEYGVCEPTECPTPIQIFIVLVLCEGDMLKFHMPYFVLLTLNISETMVQSNSEMIVIANRAYSKHNEAV